MPNIIRKVRLSNVLSSVWVDTWSRNGRNSVVRWLFEFEGPVWGWTPAAWTCKNKQCELYLSKRWSNNEHYKSFWSILFATERFFFVGSASHSRFWVLEYKEFWYDYSTIVPGRMMICVGVGSKVEKLAEVLSLSRKRFCQVIRLFLTRRLIRHDVFNWNCDRVQQRVWGHWHFASSPTKTKMLRTILAQSSIHLTSPSCKESDMNRDRWIRMATPFHGMLGS